MTKLTLNIDRSVIEKAKQMAAANHTSVSAMFTEFVKSASMPRGRRPKIGPLTRKLSGIIKLPPGKSYKTMVEDALADKYEIDKNIVYEDACQVAAEPFGDTTT